MPPELISLLAWYLAALLAGLAALPLAFRLFQHLPDRGYSLAKPLGLLSAGFVFWLLGSLGFLRNDAPGVFFAALVVAAAGMVLLRRPGLLALRDWLIERRRLVLGVEALFLAAFVAMAFVRAYNPDIHFTEKPMEFMFINSILRSPAFPPQDAWLSGHAISYYYFGYVIIAALARVTATTPGVAFNLGLALLFALTASGAHGVVLNLIALQRERLRRDPAGSPRSLGRAYWPALLGPLMVLVVGNWYGLAQLAYTNGWFRDTYISLPRYTFGPDDPANAGLSAQKYPPLPASVDEPGVRFVPVNVWDWLDLKLAEDPAPEPTAFTWNVGGNWFFGARVVHDRDLLGKESEAIDEMPAFSFLLGDMHPHVLALPFVVLASALALEWLLWGASGQWPAGKDDPEQPEQGEPLELVPSVLRRPSFLVRFGLSAVILGGLSFLNTWDFPIYLFLTVVAFALGLGLRWGWRPLAAAWWRLGVLAVGLAALSVALYFPFYLTFQSQAGGILPNLIWPTRFQQSLVFFGPVLVGAAVYLAWLVARGRQWLDRRFALAAGAGIVVLLALMVVVLTVAGSLSPSLSAFVDSTLAPLTRGQALGLVVQRRLLDSLATLAPALLIGLAAGLGVGLVRQATADASAEMPAPTPEPDAPPARPWRRRAVSADAGPRDAALRSPAVLMALALILTGALLMLGPEWVYLRDNFGWRMNTIFKFYFQTWSLWALAASFGLWHVLQSARRATRWVAGALVWLAVLGGLLYTATGLYSSSNGFAGRATLDGMAWFAAQYPDDWAGIQWLRQNVSGSPVIAEAVGGAYHIEESRFAMATGLPSVMGWTNHEGQWRGAYYAQVGERPEQIQTLYQVRDWTTAQAILDRYQIEYVIAGDEERTKYNPLYLPKFDQNMDIAFQSGSLTIYRRKPQAAQ